MRRTAGKPPLRSFFTFLIHCFCYFVVAFNLGASSCVAGPSKPRYKNVISHNPSVIGLSWFNVCFFSSFQFCSGC